MSKKLLCFVDETWTSNKPTKKEKYPIFAIWAVLIFEEDYLELINNFNKLKLKYSLNKHEGLILRSQNIREKSDWFEFLADSQKSKEFFHDLDNLIMKSKFDFYWIWIHKEKYYNKYWDAWYYPYELTLWILLERIWWYFMKTHKIDKTKLFFEMIWKKEETELNDAFYWLMRWETHLCKIISTNHFKDKKIYINFEKKVTNIIWLQFADLICWPIAQYILWNYEHANIKLLEKKFWDLRYRLKDYTK